MFTISSHEDLLRCIGMLAEDDLKISDVRISDDFSFHIIVSGDDRDGQLDANIARLVIKIQNLVYTYYSISLNIPLEEVKKKHYKDVRVTAKIVRGSDDFYAFFTEIFKELVGKMTDTQAFIVALVAIGAVMSGYTIKKYAEHQRNKLESQKDERLNKSLDKALDILENIVPKPIEKEIDQSIISVSNEIVKQMSKTDTITIQSTGETMTRKEFSQRFPKEDLSSEYIYLDGKYGISEVSRIKDGTYKIKITDDEKNSIKGTATLNQNDLRILINELIPSGAQDLQVNAKLDENGKFSEIDIIGIGVARPHSMTIDEATLQISED